MLELFVLLLFALTLFNYFYLKDYKYPPFLFSMIWFVMLASYMLILRFGTIEIYDVSYDALIIFFSGAVFFSFGGASIYVILKKSRKQYSYAYRFKINNVLDNIIYVLPVVFLPLYIRRAIEISKSTGNDNFFIGLRWGLNYGDQTYGYLKYIAAFSVINALYRMLVLTNIKQLNYSYKMKAYSSLAITTVYAVLNTGRTGILFVLLSLLGFSAVNKSLSIKKIFLATGGFLMVFLIFAIFLNKGGSSDSSFLENLSSVSQVVLVYMFGSFPAFDHFIHSHYEIVYGENTFRLIYVFLEKISLINHSPALLVQEFVEVPFQTNVYTIYEYYVSDFGAYGAMLIIYFIGFIHTYLYLNLNRGLMYKFLYAILLYPLCFSFFEDQYFSILSQWIQYFIFGLFTFRFVFKINRIKEVL